MLTYLVQLTNRMKKFIFCYFLFLLNLFIFISSGVVDSQDGLQYLAVARNIYYSGEPTAPPYEYFDKKNIHMSTFVGINGKTYSPTGIGFSLALLPSVAASDLVYKIYHGSPTLHFPLENDWVILLFASFTNTFFGALLGVIMFLYFLKLELNRGQAFFMSIISLLATNLFVYSKHIMAHMMFTALMMMVFYLLKNYSLNKKGIKIYFAGFFFGLFAITYNSTFILTLIPMVLYYLLITKFRFTSEKIKLLFNNTVLAIFGALPFVVIYYWYERLRIQPNVDLTTASFFENYASSTILKVPTSVLIEGIYGQLLSPGRSIFIYTPLLLVIIFFWHKIKRIFLPELIVMILMASIYILFYSTTYSIGGPNQGIASYWHGESSWGPRYLTPLIPLAMLIVGTIFQKLKTKEKLFVFWPLVIIGFYIQVLGIVMPYQIKYHNLDLYFIINQTEYTRFVYSNLLPRYTPIFMMTKKLVKLIKTFPKTLSHGKYNVKFFDGIYFPFDVGPERWRTIKDTGYISLDNPLDQPIKRIRLGLINHPISDTNSDAILSFFINSKAVGNREVIKITERKLVNLEIDESLLKERGNLFAIQLEYKDKNIKGANKQLLGIINFSINDYAVNMESLDYPYVFNFAKNMTNVKYLHWGNKYSDPWDLWEIHTQVFERTPDFWWIKPLYYWDLPKKFFFILFIFNLSGIVYFGHQTFRQLHHD